MSSFNLSRVEATALLIVLLLVSAQLMWPPMTGLANNGDFGRMIKWGAFDYAQNDRDDIYFDWVSREYKFIANPATTRGLWLSSEAVFVKAAAVLGYWFVSDQLFDLRMLGLIHILAFLLSFWILMKGLATTGADTQVCPYTDLRGLATTGTDTQVFPDADLQSAKSQSAGFSYLFFVPWFVLIFCDLNYTIYFHSFYTEPATLIFLLATVGSGLYLLKQKRESIAILLLFFACGSLLVGVKTQNIIFAPAIAHFGLRLLHVNHDRRRRIVTLACVLVVVLLSLAEYALTPVSLKNSSKYNAVFFGALMGAPDPRRDLMDLGVSEEYSALVGTNYHQPGLPLYVKSSEFEEGYYRKISFPKILFFYLKRPGRFLDKIQESLDRGYVPRPEYAGNFEKASGEKPGGQSRRWNLWGLFKKHYFPKSVWFFAVYLIATGALIFASWRRSAGADQKLIWELYFALWMTIPMTLVTPMLGDGFSDFERHMFSFNVLMDLSLLLLLGHLTAFIFGRITSGSCRVNSLLLTASTFPAQYRFVTEGGASIYRRLFALTTRLYGFVQK
ncbi:MAG: hypothetical protein MOB07_09030 [Acidobacteria bacterium]|nr:hypothetical protein [Acidobacteriota bacterium]